jgi:Tol biopolymer transport system component
MPDFDTRKPQEPNEPNGPRVELIANRLRTMLIGGVIVLCVIGAVAFALLYSFVGPGGPQLEPLGEVQNGKIAFTRCWSSCVIYAMNADGSGQDVLTSFSKPGENMPVWSPDGEKIAFVSSSAYDYESRGDIYVMNADGSDQTRLTNDASSYDPVAWSPDGEKIAFVSSSDIYVMNADGSDQTRLTSTTETEDVEGHANALAWSPDSAKIALQVQTTKHSGSASAAASAPVYRKSGIYVVNADGSGQQTSLMNAEYSDSPAWSPDGEKIAFLDSSTSAYSTFDIYVMNSEGSGKTRLTNSPGHDVSPAWSPDGTKIVFSYDGIKRNNDIYVMNADGTGRTRLTHHTDGAPTSESQPTWSPNGEKIAFVASLSSSDPSEESSRICVMNADGSGQTCFADDVNPPYDTNANISWGRK